MSSPALQLVPYALVAAMSPLGFAATLAVMGSGRLKALVFGCAFIVGQLMACGFLIVIGAATIPDHGSRHPTLQAALEIAFGVALLGLAVGLRRHRQPVDRPSGRSQAALERLGRLQLKTALAAGVLLGVGGPKRLVLSALAATSIAASGVNDAQEVALVVWYTALATALVWAPIIGFELFGERAVATLDAGQRWMSEHQRQVVFYPLVLLGLILVGDGLVTLL